MANGLSWLRRDQAAQAHIMVVGCGALGNEVLKNLALMGVGHLVVVDFDRVEADNLSHSVLFTRQDAEEARLKVDAVSDRLKELNADVEVQAINGDIAYDVGLGLIRQMDVVIGCVDNRWARYCINRHCMRAGIPWVDGGIDALEGTVRVFMPGENCYACNLGPDGLKDLARRMPCNGAVHRNVEAGRVPTTSVVASVIGAVEVQEALKIVNGGKKRVESEEWTLLCGKMFYYEGAHLTTRIVDFKAYDDDCAVHDCWEPVRTTAVKRDMTVADALQTLRKELQVARVSMVLADDCFVDYVTCSDEDSRHEVMMPSRAVAAFIEQESALSGIPFSRFRQHEWHEVGNTFPYPLLSLAMLGIPAQAVLQVETEQGEYYVMLNS